MNNEQMPKLPKAAIRAFDDINERFLRADHFTVDQLLSFADAAVKLNLAQGKRQPLTQGDARDAANEADELLTALGYDPATYRTDGGWLNIPKIKAAIKSPQYYPHIEPSITDGGTSHNWRDSPAYGGQICATCGAVKGTGRGKRACAIAAQVGQSIQGVK